MRSIKQALLRRLRGQTIPKRAALPFMPEAPVAEVRDWLAAQSVRVVRERTHRPLGNAPVAR